MILRRISGAVMQKRLGVMLAALLCAALWPTPQQLYADDYVVRTCSEAELDAAMAAANNPDNPQGTITFACTGTNRITVTAPKIIRGRITIDGGNTLVLSGGTTSQVFVIASDASLALRNITLEQAQGGANHGGAISISENGSLALVGSRIRQSRVDDAHAGGAIYSYRGNLLIESSELRGNTAGYGGAVATDGGTLAISDTLIIDNLARSGDGGGVQAWFATTALTFTRLEENRGGGGGGMSIRGGSATILGGWSLKNRSFNSGGGMYLWGGGTLNVDSYLLSGNRAQAGQGGGLYIANGSATIAHSNIQTNDATTSGGGLSSASGRTLVRDSLMSGNTASLDGGGISIGGGSASVERSALLQNKATSGLGGGIHSTASMTLTNLLLQANQAKSGGGLAVSSSPTRLINVSVVDNLAATSGGGIFSDALVAANFTSRNGVFARNLPQSCAGKLSSAGPGYNIVDDTTCSGALTGTADNHGLAVAFVDAPFTVLGSTLQVPQLASLGLDTIPAASCPTSDIRSVTRPQGAACDAGAVEAEAVVPLTPTPSPSPTPPPTSATPTPAPRKVYLPLSQQ